MEGSQIHPGRAPAAWLQTEPADPAPAATLPVTAASPPPAASTDGTTCHPTLGTKRCKLLQEVIIF